MRSLVSCLLVLELLPACAYHLRGNTREFFQRNEIRTLYVAPVKNNSYKSGIEITVYNALRKRINQGGYVRLVSDESSADAVLSALVQTVSSDPTALTASSNLAPVGTGSGTVQIATEYNVTLRVNFSLVRNRDKKTLWIDGLTRSKIFAASTYMYPLGSTSPLINASELERALTDLSQSIVTDADESMNTTF